MTIVDCTLRDGEQAPGVVFPPGFRLALARDLAASGVLELEAGIPAMCAEEEEAFSSLARELPELRLIAWSPVCEATWKPLCARAPGRSA